MGNRLMHYQAKPITFDRARVYEQVEKRASHTKPRGFWVSVEGEDDWPSWCRAEEVYQEAFGAAHEVRLADTANIRLVTSVDEIDQFHNEFAAPTDFDIRYRYGIDHWVINWPAVVGEYDGIIIAPYLWDRRLDGGCDWYYTWDCASGCIWNLAAIESVTLLSEVTQ